MVGSSNTLRKIADVTIDSFCFQAVNISQVINYCNNNHFLCEVCAAELIANPMAIGGPNTTVEVDESLFTRRKNHQERNLPQQWVFGDICRETRELLHVCCPRQKCSNLAFHHCAIPFNQARQLCLISGQLMAVLELWGFTTLQSLTP